ncbi:hypothetical protein E2C01_099655 [Portunus trituberculatus]|uniref:Uncharacterized protein n=1 Tax=Portunus trituberculatus TaxID=210409 RepID=A0A5B7KA70_PORTR|nr:hypothetical protein [Portunus trituberculatus]
MRSVGLHSTVSLTPAPEVRVPHNPRRRAFNLRVPKRHHASTDTVDLSSLSLLKQFAERASSVPEGVSLS